jgi:hypothetical protein
LSETQSEERESILRGCPAFIQQRHGSISAFKCMDGWSFSWRLRQRYDRPHLWSTCPHVPGSPRCFTSNPTWPSCTTRGKSG